MNFLVDENLSRRFVNALRRHISTVNVVRVQDVDLLGEDDTAVLNWALENDRILITKDRTTIPPLVEERTENGVESPKILIIRPNSDLTAVLLMIEAIINYSIPTDWQYPIRWIP